VWGIFIVRMKIRLFLRILWCSIGFGIVAVFPFLTDATEGSKQGGGAFISGVFNKDDFLNLQGPTCKSICTLNPKHQHKHFRVISVFEKLLIQFKNEK